MSMNCVKCGREIESDQAFCQFCLEEMEHYPVKPGTVVYIPKHFEEEVEKKPHVRRKLPPTPEQQIKKLKRKVVWLRILLVLALLFCGALSLLASQMVTELDFYRFLGKNYSTSGQVDSGTGASSITTTSP
jgi:hypothetical protein